jgi:hypothetical protein
MDVLHHDLETIEAACFGDLHLIAKALDEILIDNPISRREKGEDTGDEEFLLSTENRISIIQVCS